MEEGEMRARILMLEQAVRDIHWMARRYADMRSSYAPSMFNDATRKLLASGVALKAPHFARDGAGRNYAGLTDDEVRAAAEDMPRGFHPDRDLLLEALRDIAAMPDQGGCDDSAVDLWMLMRKRARDAVEAAESESQPPEQRE